ncbi:MAG: RAMP superfamily CRISPR-associated protein [Candidatus Nezhaarchaeales archaeon]
MIATTVTLKVRLRTRKKLNVGAGGISLNIKADIALPRIRSDEGELIFIHGSTIKGVLRTSLIRIAHLLGYDKVCTTVNPSEMESQDIVAKLFGKPGDVVPSKVLVESILTKSSGEVLAHVKIDDRSLTAEEGGLFSREYIPIGEELCVSIKLREPTIEELRALMMALLNLRYERIGKAGVVDVEILEAYGIEGYLSDPIIRKIYDEMRVRVG